ncbi:uncharacterized protein A1O5_04340 [Cladophialophora psammophila CBS 110553]|uniref:3-hydroxybutyrate dehydrogenase n=1 Tax=Cladophialophora psammophila CBS 110553 TaxID=1182543 RepID=W9XND6_9EURO|nr:uncharacterized protein A1O5_04340 [Cladophialophora psammophila CBS 110553]EXJ71839.1 hypothetical protein A1O5_04340 [Cladophialophora psammophila CBS 110553]
MFGDFPTKNKIVVVTGGGSGIGLAYVQLAAKRDAKAVIIADLRLTGEAKALTEASSKVIFERCDVTKWKDLQNLIDVSLARFRDVPDIYAASAGVFEPPYSNFWDDPEGLDADRYKHIDINVNHPIKLTRLAIRALLGRDKKGVVLVVASIAGYSKQYAGPIYGASKHAVVGFVRSLGDAESLQGTKVVAVCPGIVKTPIWTTGTPGSGERFQIKDEISITAETVAEAMQEVIESGKYPGGTIFEVSKLGTRTIPEWNIDPPGMVDGKMARGTEAPADAIQQALAPILSVTEKERGALKR